MHPIVKKNAVRVAGQPGGALPRTRGAGAGSRGRKDVRLLRIGEVVHAIEVTCSCGEATVVELEYPRREEQHP